MPNLLLLLPTSTYRATDFIQAAQAVDATVIVGSDRRQALANTMGTRAIKVDFTDPRSAASSIVAHAQHTQIHAIVAVDDQATLTAALAAKALRLKHNSPRSVDLTRNKASMRVALSKTPVNQPKFEIVTDDNHAVSAAEQLGFPCVLKPVTLSGSRGVIRADDPNSAGIAARRIVAMLNDSEPSAPSQILIEEYIPGDELAVEGLLRNGNLDILAIFDKPDPLEGPYFEETLYVTPSRQTPAAQAAIVQLTQQTVTATGLTEGPIHLEVRLNPHGVWLLEIAARSIGGICSRTIHFGLGASLEELILRHALDLPLGDIALAWPASGVMMLPIRQAGQLKKITGQEAAFRVPGIEDIQITIPRGREVIPLPEGNRYLGFIFARAENAMEVELALRSAYSLLNITID